MTDRQKTMAVVGAGVIGLSWARLARSHGWRVGITDPRDDLDAVVRAAFGADDSDVFTSPTLADVVAEADLVQENGPERLAIKRELFGQFLESAPEHAVLATSSSSIGATLIADGLSAGDRVIVGHPFNPPELMPLVEVVPGTQTSDSTLNAAVDLYRKLGRAPIVIRKEVPGFVANRLQVALTREAGTSSKKGWSALPTSIPHCRIRLGCGGLQRDYSKGTRWAAAPRVRDTSTRDSAPK